MPEGWKRVANYEVELDYDVLDKQFLDQAADLMKEMAEALEEAVINVEGINGPMPFNKAAIVLKKFKEWK